MRLTILGEYGPYAPAGGACSGYLVSEGDCHVLLDCGPGVLARMQQVIPVSALRAVILSHLHGDHMADLGVLRYALAALRGRGVPVRTPLPVWCPAAPAAEADFLRDQPEYAVTDAADGATARIGAFTIVLTAMDHPVPSYAMTVEAGGKRLAYSGDTRMNDRLEPLARGAGLFLCEAGCLDRDLTGRMPHLSAREAARIGLRAGCPRTVITHLAPWYDREEIQSEATLAAPGAVLARAMDAYEL
jgi:ribonuclease BN (tRNA processing enzyme)